MRDVQPQVFLVGRSEPDSRAMFYYLAEVGGTEWMNSQADDRSEPEDLVEFAGRLCYRSWKPGLNSNVTKIRADHDEYLRNILKSGHGCYDAETEVLTARGWVSWPEARESDLFATREPDGSLRYRYPLRLISYRHSGKMYRVEARGVDLLVTPDHKMLACPTTDRAGRRKLAYRLIPAIELDMDSHAYIKSADWQGGGAVLSPGEAKMLGFAIGDGNCPVSERPNHVMFRLHKRRKIDWLTDLCSRLGWSLSRRDSDRYRVELPVALRPVFAGIYDAARRKVIPQDLLTACSKPILQALLEGILESDGHRGRTGTSFDTTSDVLAGQFQHLCLAAGVAANVCYRREDRSTSYGDLPLTRLSVIQRELRPEVNKFAGGVGRSYWLDHWEGDVYCAEVPGNTLYVRRNGKPVWSGNSVLEHVSYSFVFHNVSRVLTHELVRHRAGTAVSQESMRFVRLDDLSFYIPDWAKEDEELMSKVLPALRRLEWLQGWMADHFKLDDPGVSFAEKKAKTSFMRRFAPDGVATGIMWTANVRELRHVIEARTDPAAEEEIRMVFSSVARIMKDECPALFADFTEQEDGSWVPEYRKV